MKIALAQINPTVGDYTGNTKLINKIIKKYNDVVDIIVFPEMALTGYPPQDLLFDKNFVNESKRYLKEIAKETNNTVVIVGSIRIEKKDLYNTAAILQNGESKFWPRAYLHIDKDGNYYVRSKKKTTKGRTFSKIKN